VALHSFHERERLRDRLEWVEAADEKSGMKKRTAGRAVVTSLTGFTRDESRQISELMMGFVHSPQCAGPMRQALSEIFGDIAALAEDVRIAAQSESCQSAFHTWFMFDRPITEDGHTLVDVFLTDESFRLTRGQRRYLERMRASHLRPYEVCSVELDEGLVLRDLWNNEIVHVWERAATHYAQPRSALFARVIQGPNGGLEMHGLLSVQRADIYDQVRWFKMMHRASSEKNTALPDSQFFKEMTPTILRGWLESFRTPPRRRHSPPRKKKTKSTARILQLKITLEGVRPKIWRRLLVTERMTLVSLSKAIERVMGWESYHAHEFDIAGVSYGKPDPDYPSDTRNEQERRLEDFDLGKGSAFVYRYDFGDNWHHRVVVEKVLEAEPGASYPACIDGSQACPPEDVGGTSGYAEFRRILRTPNHPVHERYKEWSRRGRRNFDPDAFDVGAANKGLSPRVVVPLPNKPLE
jgi:hypothetical protein